MAAFKLEKGGKFNIQKAISKVMIGLGWDSGATPVDIDAHAFGCVTDSAGKPTFYNDASHALSYANKDSLVIDGKKFRTKDGSMIHSGDDRTGASSAGGDDEQITIDLSLLPAQINEVSIFITIHGAKPLKQNFGLILSSFIHIQNAESGEELCRYDLMREFAGKISIQVGSFVRDDKGEWSFKALGIGLDQQDLGDILGALS